MEGLKLFELRVWDNLQAPLSGTIPLKSPPCTWVGGMEYMTT
jgi:hypothetical protein